MKNPFGEQIRGRKVKARQRMLQHAQRVSGNVSQTCLFFVSTQSRNVRLQGLLHG